MAATEEMLAIALAHKPHAACIVPEKREERTTEGGLDAAGQHNQLAYYVDKLGAANIRVSLFIEPDPAQIEAAIRLGAPVVEFHTGRYAHLDGEARAEELKRIADAAALAVKNGIEPHAGHGLSFDNVAAGRRHPPARRIEYRPFPGRRGDLHRAGSERQADARIDGRGAGMTSPLPIGERAGRGGVVNLPLSLPRSARLSLSPTGRGI